MLRGQHGVRILSNESGYKAKIIVTPLSPAPAILETVGMSSMFSDVFECSWTFPMFLLTDMGINFGIGFLRIHHPKALSTLLHCCRARRIGLHCSNCFLHVCRGPRSWIRSIFRNGVSDRALPVTARLHFGILFHFLSMASKPSLTPCTRTPNSHAHTLPCTHVCSHTPLAFDKISSLFTWGPFPRGPNGNIGNSVVSMGHDGLPVDRWRGL